ncbi:MAG: hypothetical protein ACYDAY_10145 [Candidatus Dormibacteria bacterium]
MIYCEAAIQDNGYWPAWSYSNDSAKNAFQRGVTDAVFGFAGHSLDYYPATGGQEHSGMGLAFELPNNGDIDTLAGTSEAAADSQGILVHFCSNGQCHNQTASNAYAYATPAEMSNLLIGVFEGCATAHNMTGMTSIMWAASNAGAGMVVGFDQDILFPGVSEWYDTGMAWARAFWSDVDAGQDWWTALDDALVQEENNSFGQDNGYDTWRAHGKSGVPQSLYPATYWNGVAPPPCPTCL